jgi:hypothetical protein
MNRLISQIRTPVKRQHADDYLLITLLSFAASVSGTRLFLELANYPQIGGGGLHIAHVLWGGLLLFIASLLPLILANRWVYTLGAALAGAGVGLFIDEVGKFITSNNDYFYPAAAPIIYAFFLLTALVYTRIRRPPPPDARIELYHALDAFEEVLDHDLDPKEKVDLSQRLHVVASQTSNPELSQLASALLSFLDRKEIRLVDELPNFLKRLYARLIVFENKYIRERRMRAILIGGLSGLGLVSINNTLQLISAHFTPKITVSNPDVAVYWFMGRAGLQGIVALMLLASSILLILSKINRGLNYGYYSLILSLTMVNLLVFYFDQFSTIITALIQFSLLLLVIYYRRHFIAQEAVL